MHYQPIEETGDETYLSEGGGSLPSPQIISNNAFDDVFGADNFEESEFTHPSDMRRLETEHTTTGYREGIAIGKEATLQKGFDQGYTIGAAIGLRAGHLLGTLEGIAEALRPQKNDISEKMEKLLADAKVDLSVDKIFSSEYWKGDGERKYKITGGEEAALAHPVIRRWDSVVGEQMELWKLDRLILDQVKPAAPEPMVEEQEHREQVPTRDPLDW